MLIDGSGEAKDALDADAPEEGEERDEPKPRGLHKTLSIFLRNLAPTVTKQEIEEVHCVLCHVINSTPTRLYLF